MKSVLKVKSKNTQVTQEKVEPKYVEDKATEQYLDYINESGNVMRYNGDKYVNTGINLKGPRGAVGPRGLPGKDGITPHIGENGNWYIGEQDTGNKAAFDLTFTETTYSELKTLRDNGELIEGKFYRITDYVTTTVQENTQSANHPFDVIVLALSENELSEQAFAIQHKGDEYFANSNLKAWELKYYLDNDTQRFAWADSANGKGVIYCMKDEFNNECPYDFKNIQYVKPWGFKVQNYIPSIRKVVKIQYTRSAENDKTLDNVTYYAWEKNTDKYPTYPTFYYTKIVEIDNSTMKYEIEGESVTEQGINKINIVSEDESFITYTFDSNNNDASLNIFSKTVIDNIIEKYFDIDQFKLNFIYFRAVSGRLECVKNTFDYDCHDNSFGNNCRDNIFSQGCYNNSFGNYCQVNEITLSNDNSFGVYCIGNKLFISNQNTLNGFAYYNMFEGCYNCTFGTEIRYNYFGNDLQNSNFGNNCYFNEIKGVYYVHDEFDYCNNINFGNNCSNNIIGFNSNNITLGDNCCHNNFGSVSNITLGDKCIDIYIENNCHNIIFGTSKDAPESKFGNVTIKSGNINLNIHCSVENRTQMCQNIYVSYGVGDQHYPKTATINGVNQNYQTVIKNSNDVEIVV